MEWAEYAQWAKPILPIVAEQYRNLTGNSAYTMLALSRIMKWDRSKLVNQGFELPTSFDATQPAQWNRIGSTATTAFRDSANAFEGRYGLTIRSVSGAAQQVNQTWEGWQASTSYTLTFVGKVNGAAGPSTSPRRASAPRSSAPTSNANPAVEGTAHIDNIKIRATGDAW